LKRFSHTAISILLCAFLVAEANSAIEIIDDEGETVRLEQAAERIISLAPSLTELLFSAGAGEKIVGVVEYSDFPPEAAAIPIVGRFDLLDMEKILQLAPDLVVAWQSGNPRASVRRLKQLGLSVYIAEPKTLASIPEHIEKLARLAGTESFASTAISEFHRNYNRLDSEFSNKSAVKTFYQVWDAPLITSGGNELINDIISLCGGQNIFADLNLIAPKISEESVLLRNPEVIIASGMDIERPEWLDDWKQWPSITAVENGHLYFVPPELLQRHTPRALLGAQRMCEHIDRAR